MPSDVDALISELLAQPVTGEQLRQDAPHAAGLSTADAERMRAHLLASFETRGIPDDALHVVAEELRTSVSPAVLAGAARAVRSLGPDVGAEWDGLLRDAADRISTADVFVRWHPGAVSPGWMRTARGELLATLQELRPAASAAATTACEASVLSLAPDALDRVRLEDQDGAVTTLADVLTGRETVLAFFYTRCMNPARCSLTITRLAAAARAAEDGGRAHLAMTYDPAYDSPARLRRYGAERGFPFGERARLVRTTDAWADVRAMFGLRVGYGPTTINEHARELFLVGPGLVGPGLVGPGLVAPCLVARGLDPDWLADPVAAAR
ncbi:SCO family protein [Agromyces sp. SYSU K20354]|uniref:SCO family protein n=1 Tax=Agromyces cavernae TaxID=2898659 RepID=UPI001E351063|nr:SCO family protein [Agromyces cavernae]MCD2443371.1 SCO family protein [Agromyces cavernae]